jgi:hypothetical protein
VRIIATSLKNLREHGLEGLVFLRFGRDHMQHPREANGNPRREVADARAREAARVREELRDSVTGREFFVVNAELHGLGA